MTESADTMTNLQPVPISNHNLSVFDELSHQCNAVLYPSNSSLLTIGINDFCSSYLMPITMNDYERRFQRSLQKLTIPTWFVDTNPSSKISSSSKQSIESTPTTIPWKSHYRESVRTPEIVHVRRPQSYRSCRSSLATSPSPSVHSWHPNHLTDGMNFSLMRPSSTSSSRRNAKYQKGIERVSKSSRWYQPTQFVANKSTGIIKPSTATNENYYDTPKIYHKDENLIPESICLVTNGNVNTQSNNNNMITNVKNQDNHIESDESQIMPLVKLKEPFSQIELEEIDQNDLLERVANDLVESVLADILLLENLDDVDEEDQNTGVRELSEDESGLRELDENDMNDTDEFIVIGTQAEPSDIPPYNLNRLYTFSKMNDDNSKQNSPRSNDLNSNTDDQSIHTSPLCQKQDINFDKYIDSMCPSNSHLSAHQSSEGVNEETARIGRLLLDSMQIPLIENFQKLSQTPPTATRSVFKNTRFMLSEQNDDQQPIIEECDDEFHDKVRRDSAYSSNQERIHIQQSIYEPLSECYSGYSFVQSDFLTPNISSIQSTTDEAYESEPTTMSSSIATTTHVHPDLEHEFEFPSPPPPVPDRRLKPVHLRPKPPATKPRLSKQENNDSISYSTVQKTKQSLPVTTIQQLLSSTSNDSTSPSARTMSSRHYCGTIPVSHEETAPPSSINSTLIKPNEQSKDKTKDKRNSRTLNCLHPTTTDDNQKRNSMTKSSSFSKTKIKKQKLVTDIDEATNGLAIRLPAPSESPKKPYPNKTSTPSSTKRANSLTTKPRPTFYETSV